MPELPEVETVRRSLEAHLLGKKIVRVEIYNEAILKGDFKAKLAFASEVQNQAVQTVGRRGKYLLMQLSQGWIVCHLGMTGRLYIAQKDKEIEKHEHIVFELDNKVMIFKDVRRFGFIAYFKQNPENFPPLSKLGYEPLEGMFDATYFYQCCQKSSRKIKALLLDQHIVCGIGNIYADEILFASSIHPARRANTLSLSECGRLVKEGKRILKLAIEAGGSSIRDYVDANENEGHFQLSHKVYGRSGKDCVVCGETLERIEVAGRSSVFCPQCQKMGESI